MADIDSLVKRITEESGRSEEEIRNMMDERKEATHGLLSDYGAVYAVAKEFGINLSDDKLILTKISDISPQKSFNVAGRIKAIYPPREFERKDGGRGRYASIILVDDSDEIRLVLWDNSVEITKRTGMNDILLVKNAYAKENINGEVELHAGSMTSIVVNPKLDIKLPRVKEEFSKIKNLTDAMQSVNLICRVSMYYPQTEFTRQDGSKGKRASFIAEDETGTIRVVMWDSASITKLNRGDFVKIENAYVREGMNGELEIHVGNSGRVIESNKKLKLPELEPEKELRIVDIDGEITGFTVSGRVLQKYSQRPYSGGMMASLILGDGTETIRVVLWNDRSDIIGEIKRGDAIRIKNAYSRMNMNNETEIHVGRYTELIINQDIELPSLDEIESSLVRDSDIMNLNSGDKYVRIKGKIIDIDTNRGIIYMTCSRCGRGIQNPGLSWFCDICNEEVEPVPNMVFSFTLEDETGSIRIVSFRENAEKILDMDVEEAMNLIGETQNEFAPLEQARNILIDKKISVIGRVRYNEFSDQMEFIVDNVV
ncbi:MAG TPA: hypothetical protein EYP86_00425 [Candidatus Altiarchaeales archaeon]|nr:hypothetical protein [Candidatus Altiarchaeales archaeon]